MLTRCNFLNLGGLEAKLIDPGSDSRLREAIGTSFFVGAFVPSSPNAPKGMNVIILDDNRYGPVPVRAAEFVSVKARFRKEVGADSMKCDHPDRICGTVPLPQGGEVYTELVNVSGRVAMVTGSVDAATPEAVAQVRKAVGIFVDQLISANPQ